MRLRALQLKLALAALAVLPCLRGTVVYNNDFGGVTSGDDGNENAWNIEGGYIQANSFSLASNTTVTGINLLVWEYPGDTVTSLDYAIYDNSGVTGNPPSGGSPLDGTELYSGAISGSSLTDSFLRNAETFYDLDEISLALPGDTLSGDTTYWLVLQNAVDADSAGWVGWDQSDGPSFVWQGNTNPMSSADGYASGFYANGQQCDGGPASASCTYSNSFELLGTTTQGTAAPEPGTVELLAGGLLALAALWRRR